MFQLELNFSFHGSTDFSGQCRLVVDVSRSHSDTPDSVRLLLMSDRPAAETHNRQDTTHYGKTSMTQEGFELSMPASERPQNHALDRTVTGIGWNRAKPLQFSDLWRDYQIHGAKVDN
jgi:hypothetical protein